MIIKFLKNKIRDCVFKDLGRFLNNQCERDDFVTNSLKELESGSRILDAGCGSQRYRLHCAHLNYKAQDFGKYIADDKSTLAGNDFQTFYAYGPLDYVGNIWDIAEGDESFDVILCTEVLEHVPYPNETIREFARLLRDGGRLILTVPSNSLRHMDPFYYYTGFSDRWFEHFLLENGFVIDSLEPIGDYYRFLAVEIDRTAQAHSLVAKLILFPAFCFFFFKQRTQKSIDSLCMGYHLLATRKNRSNL
ncbi:MAG: class I SAM-dependent methyltransferase [Betaproteobacteria bacterium]|nr:class I SAM-dependent methyltransferase [Betaproteobacteria bacterium]